MTTKKTIIENLEAAALAYHEAPEPGKIAIEITKPTNSQADLSLAYTPGVAAPIAAIVNDPENAYRYTAKNNLIGVISNGTAVLGLGNVGALASKPVMEGKSVLFKLLANVNAFDIEIDAPNPKDFIETVVNIAPTFGGINLEDIKAPECFEIEKELINRLDIPVFHDDQHGTAIIIAAGLLNALELQHKSLEQVQIVFAGAGSAAIATANLLMSLGVPKQHISMIDSIGVIHKSRRDLNSYKAKLAIKTKKRTLEDAMKNADIFIGLAAPNLLTPGMLKSMAPKPIVFALSNPDPEIHPELAHLTRDDLIMATGRSDYPNQINNVLCFPYIFRGALDARAKHITQEMKLAAMHTIKDLAKEPVPQTVIDAYPDVESLSFGPDYIIPKPMDPRLLKRVAPAVAAAANAIK